ncbi:MAG: phospho-sugar mutase [Clostridiaceae bacterium]|jgi:phosphoglucomutase|nr:phospho-sugar mutase [Bacillota bacterium]NLN52495.1 phospho-sugar mutase [Clostridiaceae bacterium]
MSIAREKYQLWLNNPNFDPVTKEELESISDNSEEIEDRFYQDLAFGTAGLRGVLGAGTNRMNIYTVGRAADGFARYFKERGEDFCKRGLAISYDSRHFSPEFAELVARIFVTYGIRVVLSDELRPTPMLSFAVRHFNCAGGVMITASHNPKMYNGFKAYGEDGGQLGAQDADVVLEKMNERDDFTDIIDSVLPLDEAQKSELWHEMGEEFDLIYNDMLLDLAINPEACKAQKDLAIVYTPLYGTGLKPVMRVLDSLGFENIKVVEEQSKPNGDFPSAPYPNPEVREAMSLGIELAEKENADLLIATDPDADRTGVAVRTKDGDFIVLTGNQIGLLLMEYILSEKSRKGKLPDKSFSVTTVVSTKLTRKIAEYYNTDLTEVLTGFKNIAEQILNRDEQGDEHFQFGFEESIGYLAGTKVRDKDAIVATMLIAEMAAVAAQEEKTLYDNLIDLYAKYGYGAEKTISIERTGMKGAEQIAKAMSSLRANKTKGIGDISISTIKDFQTDEITDLVSGETKPAGIPQSNVLLYELGDDLDWFAVRPSGTEPKIKIYSGFYSKDETEAKDNLEKVSSEIVAHIESLLDS